MMRAAVLGLLLGFAGRCETPPPAPTRVYPLPEGEVKAALKELGAFEGARLPVLEGFVSSPSDQLKSFDRPYYQFHIEVQASEARMTTVQATARVTAWYNDPQSGRSDYRELPSNGRLEADLLDRLEVRLKNSTAMPDLAALERNIADLIARTEMAKRQQAELREEIRRLQSLDDGQKTRPRVVAVKNGGAVLFRRPVAGAPVALRAELQDEFEVIEERGPWVYVRTGKDQAAWMRSSDTDPTAGQRAEMADFQIIREEVKDFSGEWPALQGQQTLFLWLRGSSASKWAAAKQAFAAKYLVMQHQAQGVGPAAAGVVLIFSAADAAVAAARMADIRRWLEGRLPEAVFASRCSLDPPNAFDPEKR